MDVGGPFDWQIESADAYVLFHCSGHIGFAGEDLKISFVDGDKHGTFSGVPYNSLNVLSITMR